MVHVYHTTSGTKRKRREDLPLYQFKRLISSTEYSKVNYCHSYGVLKSRGNFSKWKEDSGFGKRECRRGVFLLAHILSGRSRDEMMGIMGIMGSDDGHG